MSQSSSSHSLDGASRTKVSATASRSIGGNLQPQNSSLELKDFDDKHEIIEREIKLEGLEAAYPRLSSVFEIQEWGDPVLRPFDRVSSYAVKQFYFPMDSSNKFFLKSKVGNSAIILRTEHIAAALGVEEDGDDRFLDGIWTRNLFEMIPRAEIMATLFKEGEVYKNPAKSHQLNPKAFVLWQVLLTKILLQFGHPTEISNFAIYLLYRIMTGTKINLSMLLINHMWRCRNQARACLPYVRLLTGLISSRKRLPESQALPTAYKYIDTNLFMCKQVLCRDHGVYSYVAPPSTSAPKRRRSTAQAESSRAMEDADEEMEVPINDPPTHVPEQ